MQNQKKIADSVSVFSTNQLAVYSEKTNEIKWKVQLRKQNLSVYTELVTKQNISLFRQVLSAMMQYTRATSKKVNKLTLSLSLEISVSTELTEELLLRDNEFVDGCLPKNHDFLATGEPGQESDSESGSSEPSSCNCLWSFIIRSVDSFNFIREFLVRKIFTFI